MRLLPAAAIPVGAIVRENAEDYTVLARQSATPVEGRMVLLGNDGQPHPHGAADRLVVTYLPPFNTARFNKGDTKPIPRRRHL